MLCVAAVNEGDIDEIVREETVRWLQGRNDLGILLLYHCSTLTCAYCSRSEGRVVCTLYGTCCAQSASRLTEESDVVPAQRTQSTNRDRASEM